jgi:hypothetical protein
MWLPAMSSGPSGNARGPTCSIRAMAPKSPWQIRQHTHQERSRGSTDGREGESAFMANEARPL